MRSFRLVFVYLILSIGKLLDILTRDIETSFS